MQLKQIRHTARLALILTALSMLALTACGKKPGHLQPDESWPDTAYPQTYPSAEDS